MSKTRSGKYFCKNKEKYTGNIDNIIYRSGWEHMLMRWLDENPDIIKWSSEETIVPYISPVDNKQHRYFVDFTATFKNGQTLLIEVKPKYQTVPPKIKNSKTQKGQQKMLAEMETFAVNDAKWKAADKYAQQRGMKFCIFTEESLQDLGIHIYKKYNNKIKKSKQ
jgi:hypothetical protein